MNKNIIKELSLHTISPAPNTHTHTHMLSFFSSLNSPFYGEKVNSYHMWLCFLLDKEIKQWQHFIYFTSIFF